MFKDGQLVVRDGQVSRYTRGKTLFVRPDYDRQVNKRLDSYYADLYGLPRSMFEVTDAKLPNRDAFVEVPCRS
jgi:formylmethanofuran dehydrogenase subunit A